MHLLFLLSHALYSRCRASAALFWRKTAISESISSFRPSGRAERTATLDASNGWTLSAEEEKERVAGRKRRHDGDDRDGKRDREGRDGKGRHLS